MHVPEQNGDFVTDVAALETAIVKQVLIVVKRYCFFFLNNLCTLCRDISGQSCARIEG